MIYAPSSARGKGGRRRKKTPPPSLPAPPAPPSSPEVVQDGVEGQAVGPAGGEVEHVDLRVRARALPHPAQQDLLAVGLLQVGHDVLHDVFDLKGRQRKEACVALTH